MGREWGMGVGYGTERDGLWDGFRSSYLMDMGRNMCEIRVPKVLTFGLDEDRDKVGTRYQERNKGRSKVRNNGWDKV